jgi:hypothetical protein
LKNGGVIVVGELGADNAVDIEQSLTASTYLYGNSSVDMTVSYYDENGASYSEKFTINILAGGGSFVNVATSTPTGVNRSQLVISGYQTNVVVLEPGVQFTLQMIVQNVGSVDGERRDNDRRRRVRFFIQVVKRPRLEESQVEVASSLISRRWVHPTSNRLEILIRVRPSAPRNN